MRPEKSERVCKGCGQLLASGTHGNRRYCDGCQPARRAERSRQHHQTKRSLAGSVRVHVHELVYLAAQQIALARQFAEVLRGLRKLRDNFADPEVDEVMEAVTALQAAHRKNIDFFLGLAHRSGKDIGREPVTMEGVRPEHTCMVCAEAGVDGLA